MEWILKLLISGVGLGRAHRIDRGPVLLKTLRRGRGRTLDQTIEMRQQGRRSGDQERRWTQRKMQNPVELFDRLVRYR